MVDPPDPGRGKYKRYRARRGLRGAKAADPAQALAELRALRKGETPLKRPRGRLRRAGKWVVCLVGAWLGVSLVAFVVSSLTASGVPASAVAALSGGGVPPFSATTILVLGSDGRPPGSMEPGASSDSENGGPTRSDTMMLIRTGGGRTARLSIPRDTLVDLPGYGYQKINAAYFYGGAALAIKEVDSFLSININHVIVINFTNFPALVNSMGGVNYTGGCVDSQISGGAKNGGYSLVLPAGTHHLDGEQALILARTRENLCDPSWTDITREENQQALFSAMKAQVLSPEGLIRLPWIAWNAPQALETDMGPTTLAGVAASLAMFGSGTTAVLPTYGESFGSVGDVQVVDSQAAKQSAVQQFLNG
jgi:LCP family protein required for cell wall assembly